jgi:hypothetical protein
MNSAAKGSVSYIAMQGLTSAQMKQCIPCVIENPGLGAFLFEMFAK